VGKKKPNLNKSQVINLHEEKIGHHRTQTIHGGVPNYEVVSLKLSNNGLKSSGNELKAVLPSTVLSPTDPSGQNQYVSWTNEQIKVMTNPQKSSYGKFFASKKLQRDDSTSLFRYQRAAMPIRLLS